MIVISEINVMIACRSFTRIDGVSGRYYITGVGGTIVVVSGHHLKGAALVDGQRVAAGVAQGVGEAFGHGVYIRDSSNVTIFNMKIEDNWGDGIYLGTLNDYDDAYGCNKITIKNCTIKGNRRNNISIVDADNVNIVGCKIKNAKGAEPQAGIDIEPNVRNGGYLNADQVCRNITIKNTKITSVKKNSSKYFALLLINNWFAIGQNCAVAQNVKIKNCNLQGACGIYSGKKVTFSNSKISGTLIYLKKAKTKNTTYKKKIKWPG